MAEKERSPLELDEVKKSLAFGDFTRSQDLVPIMKHVARHGGDRNVFRLFASVCTHGQVRDLSDALDLATDTSIIRSILTSLGLSLSLGAIPILLDYLDECDGDSTREYVFQALRILLPISGIDELSDDSVARNSYEDALLNLDDRKLFYYLGRPVFVGDITKELVIASQISIREKRPIQILYRAELLESFSGIKCPVERGDVVTDSQLVSIYSYVKELASMPWERGVKSFNRHGVGR